MPHILKPVELLQNKINIQVIKIKNLFFFSSFFGYKLIS